MSALIEMKNVTKEYRGVPAITDVDFELEEGKVHALLGENGAGKSTLTKMMCGVTQRTRGEMLMNGQPVDFQTPAEALDNGVAMVFQETSLVPSMTVAQNLYLGDEKLFNRIRSLNISAQTFLQSLNFNVNPTTMVGALGAAHKQMVEIARAVRKNVQVIIFDEPTAALTPEEKHHFFSLVERLKERGVSIIFISHALEEALQIADLITVLRDGALIETGPVETFDRERIVRAMVGRTLESSSHGAHRNSNRVGQAKVLSLQNVSMGTIVKNTSFSIYAGQVTGMFGLIGSGRTETAKIIAGVVKRNFLNGGEIRLHDRSVRYRVPREAVRDGIVYVTEDRKAEGFFETMSISENLNMGRLAAGLSQGVVVTRSEMKALADEWTSSLNIRAIDTDARVIELSGGNQQKVVIAKSLVQKPEIVIFDEPTRGVDVGAIAEIHELINRLADEGMAVVVISSYLPEIFSISDRILVCRAGRVVEEFDPLDADEERVMFAAVH
ncbi:monosaccharide ABC transporter ATP-binding protein, CUT2 family [Salinihabitans flavidus]|uniref:Monosaccharide ABC transporter ATP-binding protein, CUT2 family n=1 Tax=Salinihabitans flavidus TaxID=569882 RepID=A0A1H8V7S1_9RHOB|nr:sugar ABC transporter ATP-binding protein [Salinihabitans flavidus]SEP11293.1 monosaccharide ABC transporter ATP-binding protein, CUT2 family [Salinihabitans flavidus]